MELIIISYMYLVVRKVSFPMICGLLTFETFLTVLGACLRIFAIFVVQLWNDIALQGFKDTDTTRARIKAYDFRISVHHRHVYKYPPMKFMITLLKSVLRYFNIMIRHIYKIDLHKIMESFILEINLIPSYACLWYVFPLRVQTHF